MGGEVFINDRNGGNWRGYNVGLTNAAVPEPGAYALFGSLGLTAAGFRRRRRAR